MKTFKQYISEDLPVKEIDLSQFPQKLQGKLKKIYDHKGDLDQVKFDDIVQTSKIAIPAKILKPTQNDIYLAKVLSMAVGGVSGGDLGAMISSDDFILDGHHRWGATLFNDPTEKIKGTKANLNIGDLVPVLRLLGDSFGNKRRGAPKGDLNIFDATLKDALDALINGKGMDTKFYNKEKSIEWLKNIGGEKVLEKRLKFIQKQKPPKNSPKRKEMPVIDDDKGQVDKASKLLQKGKLDVRKPYHNPDKN